MPTVLPYVPQQITVHLGPPGTDAENVTVSFSDYVKNVASSEIYPTWDESALRANILAIVSFALNRVYTEFYRSRGYDFDITNSTAYDQYFVKGRSFFDNVARLADELFNDYLRRPGFVEPLAKKLDEYFGSEILKVIVNQPFAVTNTVGKYDVIVKVVGGGYTGQAGAIRHGIARALNEANSEFRPALKAAGFLTRDPRMKERKKYGMKKARKAPQFSKR